MDGDSDPCVRSCFCSPYLEDVSRGRDSDTDDDGDAESRGLRRKVHEDVFSGEDLAALESATGNERSVQSVPIGSALGRSSRSDRKGFVSRLEKWEMGGESDRKRRRECRWRWVATPFWG